MDSNSKPGGTNGSVTPSTALLNQSFAISKGPRMLTPYEIDLLRKSAHEMTERFQWLREQEEARKRAEDHPSS